MANLFVESMLLNAAMLRDLHYFPSARNFAPLAFQSDLYNAAVHAVSAAAPSTVGGCIGCNLSLSLLLSFVYFSFPSLPEEFNDASVIVVFDEILSSAVDVDIFEKTSAISGSVRSFLAASIFGDSAAVVLLP